MFVFPCKHSMRYLRCRTDEQAPIPTVLDGILVDLWKSIDSSEEFNFVFNCQMGRGRTTTGMVVTSMLFLARDIEKIRDNQAGRILKSDELSHYLNGDYRLIMQLLPLLENGKLAKRIADRAIDTCAHIQNLRTSIYDFKVHGDSERGVNYLLRYFYLIVFAQYLIEVHQDHVEESSIPLPSESYTSWLHDRREIMNLIAKKHLIDLS